MIPKKKLVAVNNGTYHDICPAGNAQHVAMVIKNQYNPDFIEAETAHRLAHCWNCHDDLLEALESLLAVAFYEPCTRKKEACEDARAAIAKAQGHQ